MPRGEQETNASVRQPLLQNGQQPQPAPAAATAPAAAAARPSRGTSASEETDGLTKWGPIAVVILVLLACGAFAGTIVLLSGGPGGDPPPLGRKGCAAAVIGDRQVMLDMLADTEASELERKHPRTEPGPRLLIWGGKGRHQAIFDDLYELDLIKGRWRRMAPRAESERQGRPNTAISAFDAFPAVAASRRSLDFNASIQSADPTALSGLDMPPEDGLPRGRWKMVSAGIPTRHGDGMVVFGGDTLVKGENKGDYLNDVWLLQPKPHGAESAVWHPSTASDAEDGPEGRRAAAGAVWHGPGQTTPPKLLVHGGRNKRGDQLNDLWAASLEWPNVAWSLLDDGQKSGPEPRKGHTATMRPGPAAHLLVYGGRDETDYFDDLWAYDLEFNSWEQWLKRGSGGPMGRDHHAAVVVGNQFIIYGGRGGPSHEQSKILTDMWSLDLTTMNWTEIKSKDGPIPPARFLHSFDMFLPRKSDKGDNESLSGAHPLAAITRGIADRLSLAKSQQPTGQIAICPPKSSDTSDHADEHYNSSAMPLSGALMQDEHQLAGRKLLSHQPLDTPSEDSQEDGQGADGGKDQTGYDSEDDEDEDDSDVEDDSEEVDKASAQAGAAEDSSAPVATTTAPAPMSGDLDKHHHHHHKHHKHSSKHDKKKHKKHHKGKIDPDPAQGSYSDAKLVVFGGQGEGGCYLNDAWEFNPVTSTWRQISPIVSDDWKCVALENSANAQNNAARSGLMAGLRWLSARPGL